VVSGVKLLKNYLLAQLVTVVVFSCESKFYINYIVCEQGMQTFLEVKDRASKKLEESILLPPDICAVTVEDGYRVVRCFSTKTLNFSIYKKYPFDKDITIVKREGKC
jgi:hypothetical protein